MSRYIFKLEYFSKYGMIFCWRNGGYFILQNCKMSILNQQFFLNASVKMNRDFLFATGTLHTSRSVSNGARLGKATAPEAPQRLLLRISSSSCESEP